MGFTFSIKKTKPLKNEETKNRAIVKLEWSEFKNLILTKVSFVTIVFVTSSKTYYACE